MKRQLTGLLLLLVVATGCGEKVQEVHPEEKVLTAAVYASGTLLPEQEYKAVSSVDGYLVSALVKEGDTVRKGQLLFRVSSEVRQAQQSGAAAIVEKTLPTVGDNAPVIKELEGRIAVSRIKKEQDSLQYLRYKNLYEAQAITKSNYEKYYLQYQSSAKEYQNLKEQLQQQKLSANIQLQQAKNQLSISAAQSDVGVLKSYVDGVVYDIYKKEGDLITPNQPVALIGAGRMIAKLLVDENDLDKIYEGQKVLITMDAFRDKIFNAKIDRIYPVLNKVEQSFRVDAVLDEAAPVEIYGLNLEANIVVTENKKTMAIPKAALLKGDSVIVKKDGKEVKVKIQKGIEDDTWVEVLGGVDKSSTIIVR